MDDSRYEVGAPTLLCGWRFIVIGRSKRDSLHHLGRSLRSTVTIAAASSASVAQLKRMGCALPAAATAITITVITSLRPNSASTHKNPLVAGAHHNADPTTVVLSTTVLATAAAAARIRVPRLPSKLVVEVVL